MKVLLMTFVILTLCFFIASCSLTPVVVQGSAMKPNFNEGDKMLVETDVSELKHGDVVTLLYPKDQAKQYIKRIIALPNEKVEIREGIVLINGSVINEPYINPEYNQLKANMSERQMPENQYFVLGDNRDNSSDSRYWGNVKKELIVGKYYYTYSAAKK